MLGVLLEAGHDLEGGLNAVLLVPLGMALVLGAAVVVASRLVGHRSGANHPDSESGR